MENISDSTKEVYHDKGVESKKTVLWILLLSTLGTKTELNYIEYRVRTCYIVTARMTPAIEITRWLLRMLCIRWVIWMLGNEEMHSEGFSLHECMIDLKVTMMFP